MESCGKFEEIPSMYSFSSQGLDVGEGTTCLTFGLWPLKSNRVIIEFKLTFGPNLKEQYSVC